MNTSGANSALPSLSLLRVPLRTFIEVPFAPVGSMQPIEVQWLALPDGTTGHMVKIQPHNGVVDLYPEAHLGFTCEHIASDHAFTHLELMHFVPTELGSIGTRVSADSARCWADFDDHLDHPDLLPEAKPKSQSISSMTGSARSA